ncbi:cysteine-rich receptor-like protein kinase, partial [Trifolium pratense]
VGVAEIVEGVGGGDDGECQDSLLNSLWRIIPQIDGSGSLNWRKVTLSVVPLKVFIFAWRLLRDSYLPKSTCTFDSIWSLVSSWIGSSLVTVQTLSDHFVQFTTSAGGLRA